MLDPTPIPVQPPYRSADPKWGTYNYGPNPISWDHVWKDIIPIIPYGSDYTPGLTTVTY